MQTDTVVISVKPGLLGWDVEVAVVVQSKPAVRTGRSSVLAAERRLADEPYPGVGAAPHAEGGGQVIASHVQTRRVQVEFPVQGWLIERSSPVDIEQRAVFLLHSNELGCRWTGRVLHHPGFLGLVVQTGKVGAVG